MGWGSTTPDGIRVQLRLVRHQLLEYFGISIDQVTVRKTYKVGDTSSYDFVPVLTRRI